MIQECAKAGFLKKSSIGGLVNLDKPLLDKVWKMKIGRRCRCRVVVVVAVAATAATAASGVVCCCRSAGSAIFVCCVVYFLVVATVSAIAVYKSKRRTHVLGSVPTLLFCVVVQPQQCGDTFLSRQLW